MLRQVETRKSLEQCYHSPMKEVGFYGCTISPTGKYNELFRC